MILLMEDVVYDNTWYNASKSISLPIDISKSPEIGIHCGSANQALKRQPNMKLYLFELKPNIKYFSVPDDCEGLWGDLTSVRLFKAYDIISYEEFINLQELVFNAYTQLEKSKIVRDFFLDKGYDAFVYVNKFEDSEDEHPGLCVFNPDKIQGIIQVDKETLQPINEKKGFDYLCLN